MGVKLVTRTRLRVFPGLRGRSAGHRAPDREHAYPDDLLLRVPRTGRRTSQTHVRDAVRCARPFVRSRPRAERTVALVRGHSCCL
jgi:hypothetical protein